VEVVTQVLEPAQQHLELLTLVEGEEALLKLMQIQVVVEDLVLLLFLIKVLHKEVVGEL
jgi:hypothetical protein